jgi:MFS family permease
LLKLLKKHPYLLGFCLLSAAFSGPGQTYFISLYIPSLRAELGLSRSLIAALYSGATLFAAALVPLIGRSLDRFAPVRIAAVLGRVHTALGIFAAFALLRLFGQSGLSITAVTTAARSFHASRGKALGITSMGFPLAEMTFPFLAAVLIGAWGWRNTTIAVGCFVLITYLPASHWFYRRGKTEKKERNESSPKPERRNTVPWTLSDVLRNFRFYCFLSVMFIPPFMFTGVLFHQGTMFQTKGWPISALATALFCFGLFRALLALGIGPVIDRFTARTLYGVHLFFAASGLLLLALWNHPASAAAAFSCFGTTVGMGGPIRSALFAEMYGTEHLGSINGVGTSFVIFATAAAPVAFGIALDRGVAWNNLMFGGAALAAAGFLTGRIGAGTKTRPEARRFLI